MFNVLAQEKHNRQVTSDHNRLIREAAADTVVDDTTNEEIDVAELDTVMDSDGDAVSQKDIDSLESLIGTIADNPQTDVNTMTSAEISKHVDGISTPTIDQLDE